jgi:hypothetical protein
MYKADHEEWIGIPAGILSIPAEFLESIGFRRNSWIPPDSGQNQWGNGKYCFKEQFPVASAAEATGFFTSNVGTTSCSPRISI